MGNDAGEKRSLDFKILCDRLDDPVAFGESGQVVLEVAGCDERSKAGLVKRCRFGFAKCLDCRKGEPVSSPGSVFRDHVQQEGRNSGVGQMRGDARAHGSGAEHRPTAHQKRLSGDFPRSDKGRGRIGVPFDRSLPGR